MFKKIFEEDVSLHSGIPKCYSHLKFKEFNDWEIPPWEIYIDSNKLLGEGTWAKVYLAEWRHTTVVAKVLKNDFDKKAKELIIKELDNMTKMHHPNIVQLFGYVEDPFTIVMEYFQNGDLFDNLNKLKMHQKIKIGEDIIKGLIYIHERRPHGLIHRDIKLRNILLTNSYSAKIADFGLSTFSMKKIIKIASCNNLVNLEKEQLNEENEKTRVLTYSHNYQFNKPESVENLETTEMETYTENDSVMKSILMSDIEKSNELTTEVGTLRYMAPEIKTGKYNNLVDIYSCGILLYELFTNNLYVGEFIWNKNLPPEFTELINKMTNINSEDRMRASLVLSEFKSIDFNQGLLSNFKKFRIKF
jgi:serine/threonine protein kinase